MKEQAQVTSGGVERQIVAWRLGGETYGVDIAQIHTVIIPQSITPVPQTPDYMRGVMNLRGQILPVIDLRTRFGMPQVEADSSTRIVIVNVDNLTAGLIVDSVSEVLRLPESMIEPPSGLLSSTINACITGIGKATAKAEDGSVTERLVLLLNPTEVLTGALEGVDLSATAAAVAPKAGVAPATARAA